MVSTINNIRLYHIMDFHIFLYFLESRTNLLDHDGDLKCFGSSIIYIYCYLNNTYD